MRFICRVLLLCFVFPAVHGCKSKAEPSPILIGHVAPLSGPEKWIGERARQAILLAVEAANKEEDRVSGRPVAVLQIDSRGDLDILQPKVVRLITVNRVVALMGGVNAAQAERLGHAAQPYEVALITPAALPVEQMADNVFSVNASLASRGQVLARFAATELRAERLAVLVDGRQTASIALAEAFNKEFSKPGSHVLRQRVYNSEADLAKTIEDSKDLKPQAILFAGAAAELAKMRTTLQAAGLTTPILLGEDSDKLAVFEVEPKPSNAVYLTTAYVLEGGTPELREFAKKYQERFHESPGSDAFLAYDGVRILLQAMRRAKIISATNAAAKVRAELAGSEELESLTGRILFNKDHSARRPLFVVRFENGALREAKRFDPEGQ